MWTWNRKQKLMWNDKIVRNCEILLKITLFKTIYNFRVFDCVNTIFYTQNEKDYLNHYKSFLYNPYYVTFF